MKTIKINFDADGASFGGGSVSGFAATVQACLVTLGCDQGSDPMFPTRGTNLRKAGASGALIDANSAQHASNFAAVDVLFFVGKKGDAGDPDNVATIKLQAATLTGQALTIKSQFTSIGGKTIGALATI